MDGVIEAHRHIDEYLRHHGLGQLEYTTSDLEAGVRDQLFEKIRTRFGFEGGPTV